MQLSTDEPPPPPPPSQLPLPAGRPASPSEDRRLACAWLMRARSGTCDSASFSQVIIENLVYTLPYQT